jgi:hypothetical protein
LGKIDLEALSIDDLAALRDNATEKLAEKVAARQAELEAELERLSRYGKVVKKSPAAAAKPDKLHAARESAPKEVAAKDPAAKSA